MDKNVVIIFGANVPVLIFVSQKAPVHCLDLFAINGVTVLLLASPSASAHRSLHFVAVNLCFRYFGLRPTQKPLDCHVGQILPSSQ
ncbi:MAG: hypothetical protein K6C94_08960 [Candidatus Gastranaerophilales bacterium]|nr:hypothetical protein [Candidatus Gastranaerophilales bacterium]